jgi:ATP-dependent DNA helicase RecG
LKLLVDGNISNAAVVLFCRDPMPYYPQCLLRMAKFKGTDKSDLLDSRRVYGNAFTLLEEAENFLMRHMSIKSTFIPGKMARKDIPDYPPRAVREAVVNAICHRDYTIKGGSMSFLIYSDRLEIASHGTLPLGIAIEDLKRTHESQPRNDHITQVMYKRGIIESVGTGTEEMIKECRAIGKPDPKYLERGTTFVVCFKARGIADIVEPHVMQEISERQKVILEFLLDTGALSSTEILKGLDLTITERTLRRDLNHLMKLEIIKVKGKGPNTLWYLSAFEA